jgi:WD40 repeat protein
MMQTVPLDIVGEAYPSRSKQLSKQTCVNLYPEINDGVRTPAALYCWPGLTSFAASPNEDRGLYVFNGELYQVAGQSLLKIASDGTVTTIGAVQGSQRCVFADDGQNLVITSPARIHVYDGTTVQVGPSSNLTSTVAMVNNRAVYDQGGGTWATANVFAPLVIDPENIAVAEAAGDDILRVFSFNQILYLCGQKTIESWYNSGIGSPPFDRIEGGIIQKGIAGRYAICNDDELAYFLGDDRTMYALSGYQPRSLMTPAISHEFESYADVSDVVMWTTHIEGQDFVILDFPSANKTWGFSRNTNAWFQLSSGETGNKWAATSYAYCYGKHIVARSDGNGASIAQMRSDSYSDVSFDVVVPPSPPPPPPPPTPTYLALGTDNDQGRSNATTIIRDAITQAAVTRLSATGQLFRECLKVAFSPDGDYLATIEDNAIVSVYDTTSWTRTTIRSGGTPSSIRMAWSNSGRYLALAGGANSSSVSVFDKQANWAGTDRSYITAADSGVRQLAWSPDDSQLAVADIFSRGIVGGPTGNVVVFNTSNWTWQIITKGSGSTDPTLTFFTGVAFSPDGQTIAATCFRTTGNTVVFNSASTLTQTSFISRTGSTVSGQDLYYNSAGTHIAFTLAGDASNELVEIWDVTGTPSKETLSNSPVSAPSAYDLSWSPDGAYIAVAINPTSVDVIALIDASTWTYVPIPDVLDGGGNQLVVYSVSYAPGIVLPPPTPPTPPLPPIITAISIPQIKERITAPFNSAKAGLPLGKRLMMNRLELIMETGVGLAIGQGSDPEVMISCSADGGQTFGPEHFIKVGKGGEYMKKVEWYNIQSGYEFVFRIRFSDPTFFCLHGAVIDVDTAGY